MIIDGISLDHINRVTNQQSKQSPNQPWRLSSLGKPSIHGGNSVIMFDYRRVVIDN